MTSPEAHERSEWSFLIPAAGSGLRLGLPAEAGGKHVLVLHDQPLWQRAVAQAQRVSDDVWLAVPPGWLASAKAAGLDCEVIAGGATRHETLALLSRHARRPWAFVHDVARPFASTALMQRVARLARQHGFAACGTPLEPPFAQRTADGQHRFTTLDGAAPVTVHTPLALRLSDLCAAHAQAEAEGSVYSSTLELMDRAGHRACIEENERWNFKITHPADWALAGMLAPNWDATQNRSTESLTYHHDNPNQPR